jgi:F-box-like
MDERARIQQEIDTDRDELDNLLHAITALHAQLHRLEGQKQALEQRIASNHNLFAPSNHLPVEVLAKIFGYFVDHDNMPETLLLVSKKWHDSALGFGHLWSTIHIEYHDDLPDLTLLPFVQLRLTRSRGYPLDISVREHTHFATDYAPDLRACIESIIGQNGAVMARWRSIRLHFLSNFLNAVLDRLVHPAPLLENVEIVAHMHTVIDLATLSCDAPLLRRLSIDGKVDVFVPGVAELRRTGTCWVSSLHLIGQVKGILTRLELVGESNCGEWHAYKQEDMAVELPNLRYLAVYNAIADNVICNIHAPGLYTLELHSIYDDQLIPHLIESLDTNRGSIQTLVIRGAAFLEEAWKELLIPLENLRELLCEDIWAGLDPGSLLIEDREICPKLERLEMDGLIVDTVIPMRSAFRVGDTTRSQ